jgi:hypothetical protein
MVSWFISPWEAARISMEAQRMIAAQFFGFAFPRAQAEDTHQAKEQIHKQRTSDREKASVNCQDHPNSASSQLPRKRAIATRSNARVTKRTNGTRKRRSRAGKSAR